MNTLLLSRQLAVKLPAAAFSLGLAFIAAADSPDAYIMPLGDSITRGTNIIADIPGGYRRQLPP